MVYNFGQAERFRDAMDYLEAKSSNGFAKEELSDEMINQNFKASSKDVVLKGKMDSLLSLSVYYDSLKLRLHMLPIQHIKEESHLNRIEYVKKTT